MYYYRHTTGPVYKKPDDAVEWMPNGPYDYFDDPFIAEWWHVEEE